MIISYQYFSSLKIFLSFFLSFEKDKKDYDNIIASGKPSILFFKYSFNFIISLFDILLQGYNTLSEVNCNGFNLIPSYKTLMYIKY